MRIIEERWTAVGFDVIMESAQKVDPKDGQPLFGERGLPVTEDVATLIIVLPMPDGQRIVRIPFTPDAKQQLVQKLTHGIVVANGSEPHLPFGKVV